MKRVTSHSSVAAMRERAIDVLVRGRARTSGYDVDTSPVWTAVHDDALARLGPPPGLSTAEVAELARPTDRPKLHVVVSRRGEPVLVSTLRRRQQHWEPVAATVVIGGNVSSGAHDHGLDMIGHDIVVPETFESPARYPGSTAIPFAVHGMALDGRHEHYWRSSKAWKDVRATRGRTAEVEAVVGDVGALTWAIDNWRSNWSEHQSDETGAAADMERVWPGRLAAGRLFVVGLRHRGDYVAANVNEVASGVVYGLITARDVSWSRGSLGTRLIDETFRLATESGLERIDLGGYSDYKRRFAPVCDVRHTIRYDRPRPLARLAARSRTIVGR